jgi:hypothetical protein
MFLLVAGLTGEVTGGAVRAEHPIMVARQFALAMAVWGLGCSGGGLLVGRLGVCVADTIDQGMLLSQVNESWLALAVNSGAERLFLGDLNDLWNEGNAAPAADRDWQPPSARYNEDAASTAIDQPGAEPGTKAELRVVRTARMIDRALPWVSLVGVLVGIAMATWAFLTRHRPPYPDVIDPTRPRMQVQKKLSRLVGQRAHRRRRAA